MRNNTEEKSNGGQLTATTSSSSSTSSSPNSSPSGNPKVRIAVFGQHEVGKSALTVRYLTKRYIGEYKSNTDLLYQQTVKIGNNNSIDVEIVDISTSGGSTPTRRKSFPLEEIPRADGFVIVYSITDRSSFLFAKECLETITNHYNNQNATPSTSPIPNMLTTTTTSASRSTSGSSSPNTATSPQTVSKAPCPILLVGNKLDLEHLRVVEKVEGVSTSMQYECHFYELSVAENSPEVYTSFQSLISQFHSSQHTAKESKRKFSVSKMLGNLRIGKTSPSHHHKHVITSQASIVDTDVDMVSTSSGSESIPSTPPVTETLSQYQRQNSTSDGGSPATSSSSSFCTLKSKLVELQSMKKRHNSPPICSL